MKELNNRGWGLSVFIVFIGVFFVAILMIAYLSNRYGMAPVKNDTSSSDNSILLKYKNYESMVKERAVVYQEKNYPMISDGDGFLINIEKLELEQEILNSCSGYVEFGKKNGSYYYSPYLKCGSYKTSGYVETRD